MSSNTKTILLDKLIDIQERLEVLSNDKEIHRFEITMLKDQFKEIHTLFIKACNNCQ